MHDAIEFRHLRYILAIAETENFTRAAKRLYLAQPSLSQQIKELEQRLGFPLFVRHRQGVGLTPSGQLMVNYARKALQGRMSAFEMAMAVHQKAVPPLRVGFSSFVHPDTVDVVQSIYRELFPGAQFYMSGGTPTVLMQRVEDATLDCALLPLPINPDRMHSEVLNRARLVVCMRADDELAAHDDLRLSEVADRLTIFRDPVVHPLAHARLEELFAEAGVPMHLTCSAATPSDAFWMVRSGCGLALIEDGFPIERDLTSRPLRDVKWTADTAFIHSEAASHIALKYIDEALHESDYDVLMKKAPKAVLPLQLNLLA